LIKTPYRGSGKVPAWEAQLAADAEGKQLVWKSNPIIDGNKVRVDSTTGQFVGRLEGKSELGSGMSCFCRVRERNGDGSETLSSWSPWHQHFVVGAEAAAAR